jgi:hypothetical protein
MVKFYTMNYALIFFERENTYIVDLCHYCSPARTLYASDSMLSAVGLIRCRLVHILVT